MIVATNGWVIFSDNKKCTRTEFACGTSFAKRCSGMVRAQVDVVRQQHSAGFAPTFFQCCCHSNVVPNTCVTKVSSQLGPQKLKLARFNRAGFRAKDVTNPCQHGDQPCDGAVYGVQHQVRPALV